MTRRTTDTNLFLGQPGWIEHLTDFNEIQLTGNVEVSSENTVLTRDEDHTIHAASYSIAINNMYDGDQVASIRARAGEDGTVAIVTDENFQVYPVDIPDLPQSTGQTAPITSTFSMGQADPGYGGTNVVALDLKQNSASSAAQNFTGTPIVYVVVTEITGTPTQFRFSKSTDNQNVPISEGIHKVTLPTNLQATGVTLNINAGSGIAVKGFLLVGEAQVFPEDD